MKKYLLISIIFCAFASANAQNYNEKAVERLNVIKEAVTLTQEECDSIILAINRYQRNFTIAYKEGNKEKTKAEGVLLDDNIAKILGEERNSKYLEYKKEKSYSVITGSTRKHLDIIKTVMELTTEQEAKAVYAINKYQKQVSEARKAGDNALAKEIKKEYDSSLKELMGDDNYKAFLAAEKEAFSKK